MIESFHLLYLITIKEYSKEYTEQSTKEVKIEKKPNLLLNRKFPLLAAVCLKSSYSVIRRFYNTYFRCFHLPIYFHYCKCDSFGTISISVQLCDFLEMEKYCIFERSKCLSTWIYLDIVSDTFIKMKNHYIFFYLKTSTQ